MLYLDLMSVDIDGKQQQLEAKRLHWFSGLFVVLSITGFVNWLFFPLPPFLEQLLSLIHTLAGFLFSLLFCFYILSHFRRTVGYRRPVILAIGLLLSLVIFYLVVSGYLLVFFGVLERLIWLKDSHLWLSLVTVFLLFAHVLSHYVTFPERRKLVVPSRFVTLSPAINSTIFKTLTLTTVTALLVLMLDNIAKPPVEGVYIEDYQYNYGASPFAPSLAQTKNNEFIRKRDIAGSMACISCHQASGEQWLASAHRHAADDPAYVRNINLLQKSRGTSATRYCEGCHAPVALLTGQLTAGGQHAGMPGTAANFEGVGCMSCHGIRSITGAEGVGSYYFSPRSDYLFEHSSNPVLSFVNEQLIKLRPALHKQELLPGVQKTSQYCGSCHSQFMDKSMNNWGWVKMQDEYQAWAASKFNRGKEARLTHPENKQCQDCHMPKVTGQDMAADSEGKINSHYFVGANVMLARQFGNEELYQLTVDFLQQDKVNLTIAPPKDKLSRQSFFYAGSEQSTGANYPVAFYRGEQAQITLLVSNHGVGHNFPGGAIALKEAWIDLDIYDGAGLLVYSRGDLLANGEIEPLATVYKEVAIDRFGKEVWRHDLFDIVGRSYLNVIPSGSTDIVKFEFDIPDWATSPLSISATLKLRKLNQKYHDWVNEQEEVKGNPIVDIARDAIKVPLSQAPVVIAKEKRHLPMQ
ncbi:multiheme c-type cytochrome [Thalassomonas sp. RHCl1]|uniref:multiheme c-type cytochrome n=1 Tax=Thalassomonas sp. RHCl1 TaxID=2995320 RepID=UPI00248C5CB4|nr:multiheme c-type cytochrome [Thalassomonas sp. RHCl1]